MFSSRWFRIFCWFAVAIWAASIFYLSTKTGEEIEKMNVFRLWDKAGHFILFGAGGAVVAAALRWTTAWTWRKIIFTTALLVSAYGWSDEWHQQFTPGRSAKDVGDWTADTLGGFFGALSTALIYANRSRPHRPAPPAA